MKAFLVTRTGTDEATWIEFAESANEVNAANESGFPFRVLEIHVREKHALYFSQLVRVLSPDFLRILGNMVRETATTAARGRVRLDRIDDYI